MSSSTFSVLCAPRAHRTLPPAPRKGTAPGSARLRGFEGPSVRGSLYAHRGAHGPFEGDRGDERLVLAAVARDLAVGPYPLRGPRPQARHGGVKARLVHEHEAPGVEARSQPP